MLTIARIRAIIEEEEGGVFMEGNSKLIALEESFDRLYGGLNAMDLMVLGLMQDRKSVV